MNVFRCFGCVSLKKKEYFFFHIRKKRSLLKAGAQSSCPFVWLNTANNVNNVMIVLVFVVMTDDENSDYEQ